MAEPNTTSAGDPGRHDRDRAAPSQEPGSRLRQALDIARRATVEPTPPATPQPALAHPDQEPVATPTPAASPAEMTSDPPTPLPQTATLASVEAPDAAHRVDRPVAETWETATQGWVQADNGALVWRPIVTTADRLDHWAVATYLGIVSGEADATADLGYEDPMGRARQEAVRAMIGNALSRGAHGVIGVALSVTADESGTVVTAAGTAVTLSHRG